MAVLDKGEMPHCLGGRLFQSVAIKLTRAATVLIEHLYLFFCIRTLSTDQQLLLYHILTLNVYCTADN
jgi:hypothetical protein